MFISKVYINAYNNIAYSFMIWIYKYEYIFVRSEVNVEKHIFCVCGKLESVKLNAKEYTRATTAPPPPPPEKPNIVAFIRCGGDGGDEHNHHHHRCKREYCHNNLILYTPPYSILYKGYIWAEFDGVYTGRQADGRAT